MAIKRTPVKATARLKDKTFKAGKTTTGSNKDYGGNKYGGAQNTQNSSAPSLSTKKTDATRTPVKATARLKEKTFSAGVTTKGSNKNYGVGGYGGVQNYASSKTGKALNLDFQNDKLKVNKNGARGISQNNKGKTYTAGKGYSDRGARPKSYNIKRFNTENKDEMIGQISQSWTKAMGDYSKKTGISPEQVVNMIETGNTANLPKSLINAYNSDKNATKIVNKEYKGVEVRGKGVYRSEEVKQAEKESKKQDSVLAAKSAKNNKASELWTKEVAAYSKKTGASPADVLNAIETGNTSSLPKTLVDAYFASENAASQWHKADANANQAAATLGTAKKAEDDKKTEAAYKAAAQSDKNYSEYLKKGRSNRYGAQAMSDVALMERAQAYATAYGGSAIQELEKESLKPFMTASQVDIYNYTLGKYGREEANKYYDSVYEQVQERAATAINTILSEETYDKIDASGNDTVKWAKDLAKGSLPFMRTFQAFYGGATDGFQNIGRTMKIAMGAMPEAEKYQLSQGAYTHNTISERLDGFEKVINDCVYSVGNMMPAITVSVATGGLGAPATVAAMASAGTTWASVFGSNYTQSMREGYTEEQAVTYAAINASFEAALQYALNGVSQVAGGFTTKELSANAVKAVEKLSMNKTAQKALKTIVSMSVDASGEFTEEYLQGVIDAYVRNAVFGENNDTNPFTWEKIYQGLLGALTAYSMNITSAVSENTVDGISLDEAETGVLPQGRMSAQRGAAQNTSNVQAVETPALNKYAGKEVVDSVLGRRGEASVSMIAKYSDAETAAEAKFSIVTNNKGQQYVKADRQVIKGNSPAKWKVDVENYINNSIRQGKDVQFTAADGDILTITADTAGKAKFRNTVRDKNGRIRIMTKKEFAAKLRAEAHIDEVSQVSIRGAQTVPDYKNHSFAKDGFNYRTAYFEDVDGTQYKLTVSVGIDGSIKTIYNIGKLNKTQFSLGAQDLLYNQGPADALSIQRNNDLLQNQYSPDSGLTENYVSSEPSPDTVVQTLQVPSTMSENAVPLQELGTRIGEDSYSADNVPQAADSVKLPMVEKYSDAETAAEAAENIAVNNSIRGRAEYDTIDANEDGGITYNESANVFDSDERWVGIRETGGPESVCESTASLAERRAAADNVRKTGGYERFSIETNDQEITLDIISDENLLPEDAKFLQKYNKEKRGQETKFFIGNAEIKTDSGIFYADAFITDGEVYLSLDADAMLNNNDHEDFHDLYKKYEQETDAFAAQVLKALEDGGEFESVFSDYQRKYSFLKSANEVYEEILADIYAHKLKITMQDEANIAVSELKNVIDKKRTPTQTEATRKSGFSVAENTLKKDSLGRKLSDGQREFFADTKIVDDNGNLKPMYHGTNAEFTVFMPREKGGANGIKEGFGNYLTDNKEVAEAYGGRIIESYVNITHPAASTEQNITKGELVSLIKELCEDEARQLVHEEGYGSVAEAIKDTWISNYVDTYNKSIAQSYQECAEQILSANDNDMDVVQEVMKGMSIRDYDAAYDFYDILADTLGIDGFVTEWEDRATGKMSTIALPFNSNQIKNTDNLNPTGSEDIRFNVDENTNNKYEAKATTIKKPYKGSVPVQENTGAARVTIPDSVYKRAKSSFARAQKQTGKSFKGFLVELYRKAFERTGGQRVVSVNGVKFNGEQYEVSLNPNTVRKVISDKNVSAEKLSVLENINNVVGNGKYVGSGEYIAKKNNPTEVIRYDYFETPVNIGGAEYIVTFDVEVLPGRNNYRTHKVINEIDLTQVNSADTAPEAAAPENRSGLSNNNIPQDEKSVKQNTDDTRPKFSVPDDDGTSGLSEESWAGLINERPTNEYRRGITDEELASIEENMPVEETEGEKLKRWKEQRTRTASTDRLIDVAKRVKRIGKYSGPELKARIQELVGELDTVSKGISDGTRLTLNQKITDYLRFIEEAPGAKKYVKGADGKFTEDSYIQNLFKRLNGTHVADMSAQDVLELTRGLQMLEHEYKTAKKELKEQNAHEIEDLGETWIKQMDDAGAKKLKDNALMDLFSVKSLRPQTFFKEVDGYAEGGVGQYFYDELQKGERKGIAFMDEAENIFADFIKTHEKEMRKWYGKKADWIDTGVMSKGVKIELTPDMRMALYLNSKGHANMRHMVGGQFMGKDGKMHAYDGGGITIPDKKLWKQGKFNAAVRQGKKVKLTEKTIKQIVDGMPSLEKEFADMAFDKFFNGLAKDGVNNTSLMIDGYEKAVNENYYPIITDANFVDSQFDALMFDATIEGMGMLQERVSGAHNPIVLKGMTETLRNHINSTAKYVGLAAPIRNFMKVYNYNRYNDASVKSSMMDRMGVAGERYVSGLMKSLQGGTKPSDFGRGFSRLRSHYAGAVLTLNPGVVLKQAMSYPTAAAYFGWNNITKGFARKVDEKTARKYSVLLNYRWKGNSTMELGDIVHEQGMTKKLPWLLNWIQQMDNATVKKLWGAAECYVEEKYSVITPEEAQKEYNASTDEGLLQFINRAKDKLIPKSYNHDVSDVTARQAEDIKQLTGIDVKGFKNNIDVIAVEHVENRHGKNGESDSSMENAEDLARLKYVLDNYDSVEVIRGKDGNIKTSSQFKDSNNSGAPEILFVKRVNGNYYVAEAVADAANKKLHIISAYKNNGQVHTMHLNGTPVVTSETSLASKDKITSGKTFVKGSEEYYRMVGEELDNAIMQTQPNYTTMQRPEILRTENEIVKSLTMFKTQTLQNFNIFYEAAREVQYKQQRFNEQKANMTAEEKEVAEADLKKSKQQLARSTSALIVAAVGIAGINFINELIKGRWDKFQDDDDKDKLSAEKILEYIGINTGSSLAGNAMMGSELYSYIISRTTGETYYGVEAPQIGAINDFTDTLSSLLDTIDKVAKGDKGEKALWAPVTKLAEQIGQMFGVPAANIRKYVAGIVGNFNPEFKAWYEDKMYGTEISDVKKASAEGISAAMGGKSDYDAQFDMLFENRNGTEFSDEAKDEMKRLFTMFKDVSADINGIFLSDPDSYTHDGITYDLKEDEKKAWRQWKSEVASKKIDKLISMPAYEKLPDEQKAKAIEKVNELVTEEAKRNYLSGKVNVEAGKNVDIPSYALYKASITEDMAAGDKKRMLLDLGLSDDVVAGIYAKEFEQKTTKNENTISYAINNDGKTVKEFIESKIKDGDSSSDSADKPKVENNAETKIAEAKGYALPKYRTDTLQKIADMGISPEDYAYVRDRVDGHEDKVDYLKSLKFDKQTTASLVEDLVMGDKAHDKMTVAEESYNIPNSTYIDTYMFGYASVGTKAERNEQIHDYVYGLPGLSDTQKEYLYEANQVYRKKNATGEGETGGRTGKKKSSGSSGGRRSGGRSSGRRKSGGTSGKAKSATGKAASVKSPAKITPRISGPLSSGGSGGAGGGFKTAPKTSSAASIVKNAVRNYAKISSNNAMNTAYKSQAEQIDKNPFMTAKQKASAKNRLKRALGL